MVTDAKKVTKLYISVTNTPTRIDVSVANLTNITTNESKTCFKHGKSIGSKDTTKKKKKKTQGKVHEKVNTLVKV